MQWLVNEAYPDAEVIRVVLDNLNTHTVAALYETFTAAEADRLRHWLEFHYPPKHGSWLNMAEIEFSIFARQAWPGYVPDAPTLQLNVQTLRMSAMLLMPLSTRFFSRCPCQIASSLLVYFRLTEP